MFGRGRKTTRTGTALKLALPLMALGVLSTLFLFAERPRDTIALPYSQAELGALAEEMRLGAPRFSTVTEDGAALVISAAGALPDAGSTTAGSAQDIVARLRHRDGLSVDIQAPAGRIDARAGIAGLSGGVIVETATGYRLLTDMLDAALDRTRLQSAGPVTGTGPLGTLDAGRMDLSASPDAPDRHVLVFKDGVRLIYDPRR